MVRGKSDDFFIRNLLKNTKLAVYVNDGHTGIPDSRVTGLDAPIYWYQKSSRSDWTEDYRISPNDKITLCRLLALDDVKAIEGKTCHVCRVMMNMDKTDRDNETRQQFENKINKFDLLQKIRHCLTWRDKTARGLQALYEMMRI